MSSKTFKSLDLNKLINKKNETTTSRKSLKDISSIKWSCDILSGKKKALIEHDK